MKPRDIALALAAPVLWGVGFTFAKPALAQFPPMLMMVMIYVATTVLLLGRRRRLRTPLWAMLVIGACGGAVQSILIFSGLSHLPASTAVLVVQSQVPFAVLWAWLIGKERLSAARLVGIATAIGGVALIAGAPEATSDYPSLLMVVLGALVWAAAQALIRAFGRDDGPTMTGMIGLVSAPLALIGSLLFESGQREALQTATLANWGALAVVFLLGYLLAYSAWYQVLGRFRVDQVTPFILLMPVAGVITGALALGEHVSARVLAGGAIILVGLWIVVRVAAAPAPAVAAERL
ncbi:MAG TPA: DMT family transporter [Candidatus Angelobacter sp.]|nr:DMT family transporter [Candidatus Angelobacter sp.]